MIMNACQSLVFLRQNQRSRQNTEHSRRDSVLSSSEQPQVGLTSLRTGEHSMVTSSNAATSIQLGGVSPA